MMYLCCLLDSGNAASRNQRPGPRKAIEKTDGIDTSVVTAEEVRSVMGGGVFLEYSALSPGGAK